MSPYCDEGVAQIGIYHLYKIYNGIGRPLHYTRLLKVATEAYKYEQNEI